VPVKTVEAISKWTKGALARRRFKKIIITKNIQELKFPEYVGNELRSSNENLFSDKEIFLLLDYERGSKNKVWNNFFNLIGEDKYY